MTMPLRMAQNLVTGAIDLVKSTTPNRSAAMVAASGETIVALEQARDRIAQLIGGGYRLDRLQTTLLLCNEAIRQQQQIRQLQGENNSRLQALLAGLNEVQ